MIKEKCVMEREVRERLTQILTECTVNIKK